MQLRWTQEAAADLERIADYLFEHNTGPRGAPGARPVRRTRHVADVPEPRQAGKEGGTRELVMSRLPYIVVYTVRGDALYVVRILHGAQQWP